MKKNNIDLSNYFNYEPKTSIPIIQNKCVIELKNMESIFSFEELETIRRKFCFIIDNKMQIEKLELKLECKAINGPGFMQMLEFLIAFLIQSHTSVKIIFSIKFKKKLVANKYITKSELYQYNNQVISNELFINEILSYQLKPKQFSNHKLKNCVSGKVFEVMTDSQRQSYLKEIEKTIRFSSREWAENNYFRKLVKKNTDAVSKLSTELRSFLKFTNLNKNLIREVIITISEIAGNAVEHANSDCLVFCSVDEAYDEKVEKEYFLISICIMNLSDVKLYSHILRDLGHNKSKVNKKVIEALDYHKQYFSNDYTLEHFGMVANFQKEVTTRDNSSESQTGGTGLPTFVQRIEELVSDEICYVASGKKIIYFQKEFTRLENEEVGFNESCKFTNEVPDGNILETIPFNINGTMYSLMLLVKKED